MLAFLPVMISELFKFEKSYANQKNSMKTTFKVGLAVVILQPPPLGLPIYYNLTISYS